MAKLKKKIKVEIPFVDSFSLKIPIEKCKILDSRLTSSTCVYYTELDAVDDIEQPPKPVIIEEKGGVKVKLSLATIPIYDKELKEKIPTQYIVLTVSAKLLGKDYFDGITKDNLELLHKRFMDFKIFYVSFSNFQDGLISDIDVAVNRYVPDLEVYRKIIESFYLRSGIKKNYLHKIDRLDKYTMQVLDGNHADIQEFKALNVGLAFNDRKSAVPSLPFCKLYHKEFELKSKSVQFFRTYLSDYEQDIKNLVRLEVTVKNYAHKKRLKDKGIIETIPGTLLDWFELSEDEFLKIILYSFNSYAGKRIVQKTEGLKPMDFIIYELVALALESGRDYVDILSIVQRFEGANETSTSVQRSRIKRKLNHIIQLIEDGDVLLVELERMNTGVRDFMRIFENTEMPAYDSRQKTNKNVNKTI